MDLISTHAVKKSDLGFHGNLFGGKLLSWLDAAGAQIIILATKITFVRIDEGGNPIPISDRVRNKATQQACKQ